jgi:diguanylate cyclase (GGDEF)-like protein
VNVVNGLKLSVKSKLILLILLALLPALAGGAYYAINQFKSTQQQVQNDAHLLMRAAGNGYKLILNNTYSLLNGQGKRAVTLSSNARQCTAFLSELLQVSPGYLDFGVASPKGNILCQSQPDILQVNVAPHANMAHLLFFQQAIRTRRIAAGPYLIDPRTKKGFVYIGAPVLSPSGTVTGIFYVAGDLSQITDYIGLPSNAVLALFDNHGLLLAHRPETEGWIGRYTNPPVLKAVLTHHGEGVIRSVGWDGGTRMYAFTTLTETPTQTVYLAAGISPIGAEAAIKSALLNHMISFGIALLLIVFITWVAIDHFIMRKLGSLLQTANRIRNGDYSARSNVTPSNDELGQLALAVDEMAGALDRRTAHLQGSLTQLEQLAKMGELLQVSTRVDEAVEIVVQFAKQMFCDEAGAFYLNQPSFNLLEAIDVWGSIPKDENSFPLEDCWALRQGKPYLQDEDHKGPRCRHVHDLQINYLCIPILAQGEILGVVHLRSAQPLADIQKQQTADLLQLAHTLSEQAGLAMANIKLQVNLHEQATRDPLTGLYNRRYMEDVMAKEEHRALRQGTTIGILMLDIDFFKKVNDTYGHEGGDLVLQEMGKFLKRQVRDWDIACRYGGEEFVLILPGASLSTSCTRAEDLRKQLGRLAVNYKGQIIRFTVSIGVAIFPEHGGYLHHTLEMADAALYSAKQAGRNRVETTSTLSSLPSVSPLKS